MKTTPQIADLTDGTWSDQPPVEPGEYEFACWELDNEIERVEIVERVKELWATIGGEFRPVKMWHDGLTSPHWRSLVGRGI